jgi:hypothetical protein
MDYRLLRRVAVARLVDPDVILDAIVQQRMEKRRNECNFRGRGVMLNDAFLGVLQQVVP